MKLVFAVAAIVLAWAAMLTDSSKLATVAVAFGAAVIAV